MIAPLIYFKFIWALAKLSEHMHKKFEINCTKIKGGSLSGRKIVTHNSKSDLLLSEYMHENFDVNPTQIRGAVK